MTTFMEKFADSMAKQPKTIQMPKPGQPVQLPSAMPMVQVPKPMQGTAKPAAQTGTRPGPFKENLPPQRPAQNMQISFDVNSIQQAPGGLPISDPVRRKFVNEHSNQYTDDMWRQYMADKTKLPTQVYEDMGYLADRAAAQGRLKAHSAVKENSGVLAAFRNGYTNREYGGFKPFMGAINLPDMWLARNYVDIANITPNKYAPKKLGDNSPYAQVAQNQLERRAFFDKLQQLLHERGSTLSRQEHAAAHLEGSFLNGALGFVNPVLRRLPGDARKEDMSQLLTGRTTSEQASAYGDRARQDFGYDAGLDYEQNLRWGGVGTSAAGTALSLWLMGPKGLGTGGSSWRFMPALNKAIDIAPTTQSIRETLHTASDAITNGGKTESNARQAIGSIVDSTGNAISSIPGFMMAQGVVGEFGHLAHAAADAAGVTPQIAKTFHTLGGDKLVNAWKYLHKPTTIAGRPIGGTAEALAKNTTRVVADDAALGISSGALNDVKNLLLNQQLPDGNPSNYLGPGARIAKDNVLPLVPNVLDQYDTTAILRHAGSGAKEQQQIADTMVSEIMKRNGNQPLSQEAYKKLVTVEAPNLQWQAARRDAILSVDPEFPFNASPEEQAARLAGLDQTKLAQEVKRVYRDLAIGGGYLAPEIFQDDMLTRDDKYQILHTYMASEVAGQHDGWYAKLNLGLDKLTQGEEDMVIKAMNQSEGMRMACTAYAQQMVQDMINDPASFASQNAEQSSMAQAVLRALPETNIRQIMEPLKTASSDQIMSTVKAMQQMAGTSYASRRLAQAGTDIVKDRLRTDGAFAKEFIQKYIEHIQAEAASASQNGANPTKFKDILSKADVNTILQNMDDGQFSDLAKWALKLQGSMGELDEDKQKLLDIFKEAAKNRALDAVKRDPLKNLPVMTGLWLRSKGWEGMADLAENPVLFYGTAALLTGAIMFGGGYDEDDDDDDGNIGGSQAVAKAKHQRELLTKEVFG